MFAPTPFPVDTGPSFRAKSFIMSAPPPAKDFLPKILSLSASRVIQDVLQALLLLWLARTDRSGYGLFVLGAGVAGIVRAALSLGLDDFALRQFSGDEVSRGPLLTRMVEIKTGLGVFILISLVGFALLKGWQSAQSVVVVVVVGGKAMDSVSDAFFNLFRAEGRQVREGVYRTVSNLAGALYGAVCLFLHTGIVGFAFFVLVGSGLRLAFSVAGAFRMGFAPGRFDTGTLLPPGQLRSILQIAGVVLMGAFYNQVQIFLLKQYQTLSEVAYYGAASELAGSFSGLVAQLVVGAVLYPELAAAVRNRREAFPELVQGYFSRLVIHGTAVAFFLSTWGGMILVLFFGPDYTASVLPLRLLGPSVLFSFINNYLIFVFFATGREREMLLIHWIPVALSIASGLFLIPAWGAVGAAANLLICRGVLSAGLLFLARPAFLLLQRKELKRLLKPLLPAGVVFLSFYRLELYSASLGALVVYGLIVKTIGTPRPGPP
jgi:O-antigen/teichoic acid export membrane protein